MRYFLKKVFPIVFGFASVLVFLMFGVSSVSAAEYYATITPGAGTSFQDYRPGTTNVSVTVAPGSNTVLFVSLGSTAATNVSTVTYNGVPLTRLWTQADGANAERSQAWILASPSTGANTLSITWTGDVIAGYAQPWYGVAQGNTQGTTWRTPYTSNDGGSGSATASVTVSNAVSGDRIVDVMADYWTVSTADASQNVNDQQNGPYGGSVYYGTSDKVAGGATTMKWTAGSSMFWALGAVALIPADASSGDTTAPSIPTNLIATAVSSSQINLAWTASTDDNAVTGYKIYRNGTQVGSATTNAFSDTGLTPATTYQYTVAAYDAAGNTSAPSAGASATTQAGDTGNIINAASCSQANVQSAINSASNGYTVNVPAGTCSWSSGVTIDSKNITVQGAGIGNTVINSSARAFLLLGLQSSRITGFTVSMTDVGPLSIYGGTNWRIDHNRFVALGGTTLQQIMIDSVSAGTLSYIPYGLLDHNQFEGIWAVTFGRGQAEWFEPTNLGSVQATYVEDNTFTGNKFGGLWLSADANYGGRVVFRYNQVTVNADAPDSYTGNFQMHSLQGSDALLRGSRKFEMYGNVFESLRPGGSSVAAYMRAGTGVIFNNSFINYVDWGAPLLLDNVRSEEPRGTYGQCDGTQTTGIDGNTLPTTTYRGYPCRDQIGRGQDVSLFNYATPPYPAQASEPVYQWENYRYASRADYNLGKTYGTKVNFSVGGAGYDQTHIVANRDYFDNSVKPGYTPYTYPHPLQGGTTPPPTDTTAPSVPTSLTATAISQTAINLAWTASTDNIAVTGYKVYRNGTQIGTATTLSYSDTNLTPATTYQYTVAAYDAAANQSAQSTSASATTGSGTTPQTLTIASIGTTSFQLGSNNTHQSLSQSFIAPSGTLTNIQVGLAKSRTPSYSITVALKNGLTGTTLYSTTIAPSQVTSTSPSNPTWITLAIPSSVVLTTGNTYYLNLSVASTNSKNYYRWSVASGNPYSGGMFYWGTSVQTGYDALAKVSYLSQVAMLSAPASFSSTPVSMIAGAAASTQPIEQMIAGLQAKVAELMGKLRN